MWRKSERSPLLCVGHSKKIVAWHSYSDPHNRKDTIAIKMEEDLFQGDLQEYLENGNLYDRCYFQWSLIQCLFQEKHLLLEMEFSADEAAKNATTLDYAKQTTKLLERAVNAVIKGALIKSVNVTALTTIKEVQAVYELNCRLFVISRQISHGKCSILILYNLDLASSSLLSYVFHVAAFYFAFYCKEYPHGSAGTLILLHRRGPLPDESLSVRIPVLL